MRQSQLFTKTLRQAPKDEKSINARLLVRAGFIDKLMSGVYSFLPLGWRVHQKIACIIREEIDAISGQEMFMPALTPKKLWQVTGRWDKGIGEVMYKCKDSEGKEVGLGPTHEEVLCEIVKKFVVSYEDLPCAIYQIQTKFRKEPRARSGLLRGREFTMKDLYSFHDSIEDFRNYYEKVKRAYFRIFKRCGLKTILCEASGGAFSKENSYEFQVLAPQGEDTIFYCPKEDFAVNSEIAKVKEGDKCPRCGLRLLKSRAIEVGNIFSLGTKYSIALGLYFTDRRGKKKPVIMGCYGLGPSRIMGTIVEVFHDKNGIIWPKEVAPYEVHLICLQPKNKKISDSAEKLYNSLQKENIEVLYDDRLKVSASEKLIDSDLIGLPKRIVVSEKTQEKNLLEYKMRAEKKALLVDPKKILKILKS